jgi:hypothetical protein
LVLYVKDCDIFAAQQNFSIMKKILFTFFALSLLFFSNAQTTYYTCNSPSGTNLTTASDGSGTCNVAVGTWNQSINTIVIRTGTTFTVGNLSFACQVIVDNGATLQTTAPVFTTRTINFFNTTSINGTFSMPGGFFAVKNMNVGSGAVVTVGSTGTISIPDQVTAETITILNGGTLTLNGTITSIQNFDVNATGTFNGGTTGSLTIENAAFESTAITFIDNFSVSEGTITGAGNITLTRNFPANSGWNHIGWPVSGGATVGDLTSTGFALNITGPNTNQINVYYWDAATAGWLVPTAGTSLVGQPLNIYTFNTGTSVSLTVDVADFNNDPLSQSYTYFNPGVALPGNAQGWADPDSTDGWNSWVNPFQQYLDPNNFALPASDFWGSVYAWNGASYSSIVNGVGALTEISPNQAFFVRCKSSVVGSPTFSIPQAARTNGTTSFFKTSTVHEEIALTLAGEGYTNQTFIYEQSNATDKFDSQFDAFYFAHTGNAPHFNSVGVDSTAYSVQALPELNLSEQYLSFYYGSNGKTFTISVDPAQVPSLTSIMLHDLHTGSNTDLLQGNYTFTSTTAAPAQRFKLMFVGSSVGIDEVSETSPLVAWFAGNELQLKNIEVENIAYVTITNIAGQVVAEGNGQTALMVIQTGVYVVVVTTKTGGQKVLKVVKF